MKMKVIAMLAALSLTQERHAFETQFGLGALGAVTKDATGTSGSVRPEGSRRHRTHRYGEHVAGECFSDHVAGDLEGRAHCI